MLNFTVGPVQSNLQVRQIGAEQVPYFRTPEFSAIMLESEELMCSFAGAPKGSRAVFLTGSGTASMEAAVINTLTPSDKVLVVNGGTFGERFVQLCQLHGIPHTQINPAFGEDVTMEDLAPYEGQGYTAFLVNVCETSTGVRYNMDLIGEFCSKNGLFLIADAVSSFLADDCNMQKYHMDMLLTGSQKALACPPGVSIVVMTPEAVQRVQAHSCPCMYLDLNSALKNGERGQTPFTPAVGTLRQINCRLKQIQSDGGVAAETAKIAAQAADFRAKIADFPFQLVSKAPSNAVTCLRTATPVAKNIFSVLKDEYGMWVCPNGGQMADTVFRVGHIGDLTKQDNDKLIAALNSLRQRGIF